MTAATPRYLVGIDLGTTHTVAAYADMASTGKATATPIHLFEIPQLVAPGEVAARPLLPSMRYHPATGELAEGDTTLPWASPAAAENAPAAVLGELARELGSKVPGRLVSSAKSWLSHTAVDRTAPILPWGAAEGVSKVSPVVASASYLAHVRDAWNWHFPDDPLEEQLVTVTVPASFDEAARALTVEAAHLAGLTRIRLVEEPQAACYDWLSEHRDDLGAGLSDVRLLLVCDVGGGTTDLTLIQVQTSDTGPRLTRIGVGDHLMLGGDNMDLALAHVAEGRLASSGGKLSAASLSQLMQQCRGAKERLLAVDGPESATVTVLGTGARLVRGARSAELSRDEVRQMLVDGFFPQTALDEQPQRVRGGIVEFGLPYVADPAISRHIAAFLARHEQAARQALGERAAEDALPVPDAVLLNGGVFHADALSTRLLDVLGRWRGAPLKQMHNARPDLAVARGAVAYGLAMQGTGPKIGGGAARSYFIVVQAAAEKQPQAQQQGVCILPRGTEEGQEVRLTEREFSLRLGQPVRFPLVSTTRDTAYQPGDLAGLDEESFHSLPPIATVLDSAWAEKGTRPEIEVEIGATLTEVGTLAMACVAKDDPARRWGLEFQLRETGVSQAAVATAELHPGFGDAAERIERIYGSRSQKVGPREVKTLRRDLEKTLGSRDSWDMPLLRELFGALWEAARRRRRSADHERVWFNLSGYCLRPGLGYPLDDWRVQQLWSLYSQGVQYVRDAQVWSEWWTLWRRVVAGLEAEAHEHLLTDIEYDLQPPAKRPKKRPGGTKKQGYEDMVRLAGTLERLSAERKTQIGAWLLERLQKASESPHTWWAVGRIGARIPFYGSVHNVVPVETAANWLGQIFHADWKATPQAAFAATLIARMSGDRERDLREDLRRQVVEKLRATRTAASWIRMVESVTELDEADEQRVFGESLPPGLRLVH